MLSRIEVTDSTLTVTHYRLAGTALAVLANWIFIYLTFTTEGGGLLTLLFATLCLMLAATLFEIRTSTFDATTRRLAIKCRRALGPVPTDVAFEDFDQFTLARKGDDRLAIETVYLHTRKQGEIGIATYLVLRNEGGNLKGMLEEWLLENAGLSLEGGD